MSDEAVTQALDGFDEALRKQYREAFPSVHMPPPEHPHCRCDVPQAGSWQANAGQPERLNRAMLEGMYADLVKAAGRIP